ncbi:uncharacterized protein DUF3471 [Rhodopseudomonas thermotolerans]|uniref:Uncharacterized protein DUF3471 n=3 Tax=Nitrobacteraceae TaxID=41294 RepID=A0A336JM16_9BRAD|nr:uncharacterized protein DUF3471 [Rhodopseudomonas pentothenatexigens]REG08258.1 uncharacterized protein DUF3471 [Rhodopseudomonas thermotolerans]SSW89069.1 uncharacterized protein DUF3471 [Rhodopseudomonas pentothenatexigens]
MRDFRDAKAMAQTLRDVIKPKAELTHSESLELIAKVLGCQNWNVLAAALQSAGDPVQGGAPHGRAPSEPEEVRLDAAILDRYVGFYELAEQGVMTISREDGRLTSRLSGQPAVPLFAESRTKFFARIVNAQINFVTDASGVAQSLVLHQNGLDVAMRRIDAAEARRIEDRITARLKSGRPSPGTEAALRRLIEGLRTGEPRYDEMTPALAEATRQQLATLHAEIGDAGPVHSIDFVGVGNGGVDVYLVHHEQRPLYWRIGLDAAGAIATAWVTPGL